ncbi:MAG TPA: DoxX family protein [Catenuloplanes sp.]|jgi:uncharacterized membrane protein YphA (DoxX/SURF4 family)
MNLVAWILSALLAVVFIGAGAAKLFTPREKLVTNPKMAYTNDFTSTQVKAIGAVEVAGGIGVILPWLLDIARILTPLAAVGLAITMIGAMIVHARRGELKEALPINGILFALGAAVAIIRFSQL